LSFGITKSFSGEGFFWEFFFGVVPVLLSLLYPQYLFTFIIIFLLFLLVGNNNLFNGNKKMRKTRKDKVVVLHFLTAYRSYLMILTCICIIAVDFPIFPSRFAKVETFGISLMDVGVGSVVFSQGIVSSRGTNNELKYLTKSLWKTFPLFILGILRLFLVKSTNYQVFYGLIEGTHLRIWSSLEFFLYFGFYSLNCISV
jgi:phosphatidylinositol glycan class W